MPENKLKGCPWCGKIPVIKTAQFGVEKIPRYGVVCYGCAICLGWEDTSEAAVARWNRRFA